jgi:hypothetical protein
MGGHCLGRPRGATTQHVAGPSIQKRACPRGTVFDAYRGACRVMPLARKANEYTPYPGIPP